MEAAPASPPAPPVGPVTLARMTESWPRVLTTLESVRRSSWMLVVGARVAAYDDDVLTLVFASPNDVAAFKQRSATGGPSEDLRTAIQTVLGVRVKYIARHDGDGGPGGGRPPAPPAAPPAPAGAPLAPAAAPLAPAESAPAPAGAPLAPAESVAAPAGAPLAPAESAPAPAAAPPQPPADTRRPTTAAAASAPVTDWAVAPIPSDVAATAGAPGAATPAAGAPGAATSAGSGNSAESGESGADRPDPAASPDLAPVRPAAAVGLAVDDEPEEAERRAGVATRAPSEERWYEPDGAREGDVLPPSDVVPSIEPDADEDEDGALDQAPPPAPVVATRPPAPRGGPERYGEAVVRQILGARFVREEAHEQATRFS